MATMTEDDPITYHETTQGTRTLTTEVLWLWAIIFMVNTTWWMYQTYWQASCSGVVPSFSVAWTLALHSSIRYLEMSTCPLLKRNEKIINSIQYGIYWFTHHRALHMPESDRAKKTFQEEEYRSIVQTIHCWTWSMSENFSHSHKSLDHMTYNNYCTMTTSKMKGTTVMYTKKKRLWPRYMAVML